jgi:hypothetical protein
MKFTNINGIPESYVNVLTSGSHPPLIGRFSVTDLVGAPRQRMLKLLHWEELTQDVGDMLWMLLGKSVHYVLEGGAPDESLAEEKMIVQFQGATIVGIADLFHMGIIEDQKVTSVYSFLLGDKPEWEHQLNIYAWMYQAAGFDVMGLRINAILRDWQKSKAEREADYPPIPFQSVKVPFWGYADAEEYVKYRLALHRTAENWPEDQLDACTPEEMWERPTTYAVMKKGAKRALRVLTNMEEAEAWIDLNADDPKKCTVEVREGIRAKCKDYCLVRDVCELNIYRGK